MSIIERIKLYCDLSGITATELAKRADLSRQTVHRIFKTGRAEVQTVEKLLDSLQLQIIIKKTCK